MRVREYDQRRGSAASRGYDSKWERERHAYLLENPLCLGCAAVGRFEAAFVVDHIRPHKGDQKLFWSRSNWQACCKWHHDTVKQRIEAQWVRGLVNDAALALDSSVAMRISREIGRF